MKRQANSGFTLAELLIALAILGVIATFTIPKVLQAANTSQNSSIAKEVAGMISGAYDAYKLRNTAATTTTAANLTAYMNYVKADTASTTIASFSCVTATANVNCLVLHNGGVLGYSPAQAFNGGVDGSNYVTFHIDPDGSSTAASHGSFVLYGNGRLTTGANATGTAGTATAPTLVTSDPSWLTFNQ